MFTHELIIFAGNGDMLAVGRIQAISNSHTIRRLKGVSTVTANEFTGGSITSGQGMLMILRVQAIADTYCASIRKTVSAKFTYEFIVFTGNGDMLAVGRIQAIAYPGRIRAGELIPAVFAVKILCRIKDLDQTRE